MKLWKRLLSLAIAIVLMCSFVACGRNTAPVQHASETEPAAAAPESTFPEKPINFIVQYGAGGGVDVTARLLANIASEYAGQNIVIQNITGGSGSLGVTELAHSAPDGYTIGLIFPVTLMESSVIEGITYGFDSFEPICQVNYDPAMMVVKSGTYNTLQEIVDTTNVSTLNMGIGAMWTAFDLTKLMLYNKYDIDFTRIFYGTGGASVPSGILAGDVDCAMLYPNEWISYYQAGDMKGLAVASNERLAAFPDVPTFAEGGYDIGNIGVRRILVVPKGTPEDVVKRLEEIFMQALEDPRLKEAYENVGMSVAAENRENAAKYLYEEAGTFIDLLEEMQIKPGDSPR